MTVAIDGPAASGKGTIARALAARFGFAHLDTGLLYRAVGAAMLEGVEPVQAALELTPEALENPNLRTAEVASAASKVAAISKVRDALFDFQRAFAHRAGGAVLDGRDIGTVICPDAQVKLFVTASPETRAERRYKELTGRGQDTDLQTVLEDIRARDARDAERTTAPLKPAEEAILLDTTTMDVATAIEEAARCVSAKLESAQP